MAKRNGVSLAMLVALVAGAGCSSPNEEAGCARPQFSLSPSEVAPGQSVTLSGVLYIASCGDVSGAGPSRPMPDVTFTISQSGHRFPLVTAHPSGSNAAFTTTTTVPADLNPGPAELTASVPNSMIVTLTIR